MDINQQDRAALNANRCPDCGRPISLEETGPWCRACDVWFEFSISGWVIRNRDAASFYTILKAMKKDRRTGVASEALKREKNPKAVETEEVTSRKIKNEKKREPQGFVLGKPVVNYQHLDRIPVSLYRWLL